MPPVSAGVSLPTLEQMLQEVEAALAGHTLAPDRLPISGEERVKFAERKTAIDQQRDARLSYGLFLASKKPGDYRYRDIAFYQVAIYQASTTKRLLLKEIEAQAAEVDRAAKKLERETVYPFRPTDGWVYFIEAGGHIKIGFSVNVPSRMAQIETATPFQVTVLRQERGALETEAAYHERFSPLHIKGEWFRFEGDLKAFLEKAE